MQKCEVEGGYTYKKKTTTGDQAVGIYETWLQGDEATEVKKKAKTLKST